MKKVLMACAVIMILSVCASSLIASDWGCKCILCLSNPGGPTEFDECKPPIRKLERHLENRGSFPSCNEAEASGYHVNKGYEQNFTCEEGYGEDWHLASKMVDVGGENQRYERQEYCRKFEGYKTVQVCDELDNGNLYNCKTKQVPQYSEQPLKRRSKPHFVELQGPNGEKYEKVWYKRKSKKSGGLF